MAYSMNKKPSEEAKAAAEPEIEKKKPIIPSLNFSSLNVKKEEPKLEIIEEESNLKRKNIASARFSQSQFAVKKAFIDISKIKFRGSSRLAKVTNTERHTKSCTKTRERLASLNYTTVQSEKNLETQSQRSSLSSKMSDYMSKFIGELSARGSYTSEKESQKNSDDLKFLRQSISKNSLVHCKGKSSFYYRNQQRHDAPDKTTVMVKDPRHKRQATLPSIRTTKRNSVANNRINAL